MVSRRVRHWRWSHRSPTHTGLSLVTLFGQRTSASRPRSDDDAIAWVDDRLALVIPPNTIVLVTRAAQQLDYLPATRRATVQSARLNLIPHPRWAGHSRTSHVLTSDIVESFCCNSFPAPSTTVRSADSPRGYLLKAETAVQPTRGRARI